MNDPDFKNSLYTYPNTTYPSYYDSSETETTVTETFYDEEGRVVREVVTVTKTKPKSYYPYQPYVTYTSTAFTGQTKTN